MTRATVRLFLPLALAVSVFLMWQGTPMTFEGAAQATTLEGPTQAIARGVTAGVVSIKQLGTNGGGYFGPNSAHPFENPTPLSNFVETWAITIIPMSMVVMLGVMLNRRKLAIVIFATMLAIYLPMVVIGVAQEAGGNPAISRDGRRPVHRLHGGQGGPLRRRAVSALGRDDHRHVERFGQLDARFVDADRRPDAAHRMWLNNIFGGVGVGFINMLIFVIVAVFVAGMMIGRTPEFLGKKVEAKEMKLASLALLWHPLSILVGTAIACYVWATTADPGTALAWLKNPGPHGFSEMLYEFSSATANNGSGFEGLGDNTPFWNIATGLAMLLGRYIPIIAPLGARRRPRGEAGRARDGRVAPCRQRNVRVHVVGRHRHSGPVDVHAGGRARADCRAPGPVAPGL